MFELHPRLESGSFWISDLSLCQLRLMNDQRFPWLLLVPKRPQIREFSDLGPADQQMFLADLNRTCRILDHWCQPFKQNIAMLGNLVPQCHWHVIARFPQDPAWPGPVWGVGTACAYLEPQTVILQLQALAAQ